MTDWQKLIADELTAAKRFPLFNSPHEGYAVIKEELDELWDEIKANGSPDLMEMEAVHVAAMAVKFILSLDALEVE